MTGDEAGTGRSAGGSPGSAGEAAEAGDAGPSSGSGRRARGSDIPPDEEPTTTGTLFIMVLFLMAMGAMWGLMYLTLLNR